MEIRIMVPRRIGEKMRDALNARLYDTRGNADQVRIYVRDPSPDDLRKIADLVEGGA